MSIIGEPFDEYVSHQINVRQRLQGEKTRSNTGLNVLSNQNAWIKLCSSVSVESPLSKTELESKEGKKVTPSQYDLYKLGWGPDKLKAIGLTDTEPFMGTLLAQKAVLFNTLSTLETGEDKGILKQRSGILNTKNTIWNDSFSYGLGGTTFGIVPPPGIIDASIKCLNRGSIREANVTIKANNKFQFELIEMLYLRLGYSMLLEFGWDKYLDNNAKLVTTGTTITEDKWFTWKDKTFYEILKEIKIIKRRYNGNYDGFLGKVTNFDWNFNPDGTYDIKLKLITVGDVIESLKVNLPASLKTKNNLKKAQSSRIGITQTQDLGNDSAIITNASISTLNYNLYIDTITKSAKWLGGTGSNYLGLYDNLKFENRLKFSLAGSITFDQAQFKEDTKKTGVKSQRFNYFMTVSELFDKLDKLTMPSISGKKMLSYQMNVQPCSVYPFQISFDPKICLIKPAIPESFAYTTSEEVKTNGADGKKTTGIKTFWWWMKRMKPFATFEKDGKQFGDIMNIYLNYDFISATLASNTDKEGNVTLFKFLQTICDGINNALGGVQKIEVIITDDYKIQFIDQNPIQGVERKQQDNVGFEIYGYNPGRIVDGVSTPQTSNFVKNFSFNTTIGPNIASMISIGATAEGTDTKNYDGTGFAKWNRGLQDRFKIGLQDPYPVDPDQERFIPNNDIYPLTLDQVNAIIDNFEKASIDLYWTVFGDTVDAYADSLFGGLGVFKRDVVVGSKFGYKGEGKRDIPLCPVSKTTYSNTTWDEYAQEVRDYQKAEISSGAAEANKLEKFADQYINYLAQSFGGKISGRPYYNNYYYQLLPDFITLGKQLFKNYLNELNNGIYASTGTPSNTSGFIPVGLSLDCNGLGGIKIYNSIAVRQGFLPPAYPDALTFIIKSVDHKISNNNWTTSLTTISTANTKAFDVSIIGNIDDIIADTVKSNSNNIFLANSASPDVTFPNSYPLINKNSRTGLQYVDEASNKSQIVLHHTGGIQGAKGDIKMWTTTTSSPIATTNFIEQNGDIEDVFPDTFWAYNLGVLSSKTPKSSLAVRSQGIRNPGSNILNKRTLSVELTALGYIQKVGNEWMQDSNNYTTKVKNGSIKLSSPYKITSSGKIVPMSNYKGYKYFQSYSAAQLKSLKVLLDKWGPDGDKKIIWRINSDQFEDLFPPEGKLSKNAYHGVRGIYTHNSFKIEKSDVMPQKELLELLYFGTLPSSIEHVNIT